MHGVEHPPVVGDQQQRPVVAASARTPAARWPAGRDGWSARPARAGSPRAPAAAPARPGSARPATACRPGAARDRRAARTSPAACGRRRGEQAGTAAPNASISGSSPTNSAARLVDLADHHAGPERRACPRPAAIRPSSAASSVDLPEPLAPVIATRSAQSICRSTGPRVNAPRRTTAPRSVATTAPARGAAAICIRSSHSLRGSSTTSSRSISRSVWRALAACFSLALAAEGLDVSCPSSVALRRALRTPFSVQARCMRARLDRSACFSAYSSYSSRACRRAPLALLPGRPRTRRRTG